MDMEPNPAVDFADAEVLTLGGVDFSIPQLALRQITKIAPLLPAVLDIITRQGALAAGVKRGDDGQPVWESEAQAKLFIESCSLTEQETQDLLQVIHLGITRGHPRVKLDDLWELPIMPRDLLPAASVVIGKSSLTRKVEEFEQGKAAATIQ